MIEFLSASLTLNQLLGLPGTGQCDKYLRIVYVYELFTLTRQGTMICIT